jgi:glyoxylase-like metal-dependent hydrolase (beta-lactamase superfamily II)
MSIETTDETALGIRASAPGTLSFAPSLRARSFLLPRAQGNLLIYGFPWDAALGDVARVYVNHWHETSVGGDAPDAPLFVHAADRAKTAEHRHVRAAFTQRHTLDDDFEAIPTPGHTPGATAYLWDSGEHRLLFTGDTIYLRDGEWYAAVLDSSDRAAMVAGLELIRELDFDVLVPWVATAGLPFYALTDRRDTQRRIDALLQGIRR